MRRVIVTGASRGIGRAIARKLAARGDRVMACARSGDLLETLAREASDDGRTIRAHAADLRAAEAPARLVDAAVAAFGGLDLVVHSAGATKRGDFFALTPEDYLDGFALKFHAGVALTRAAWPHLRRGDAGHLVAIIGVGGRTPAPDFTIGGPVNSALMNFTKAMAERGRVEGVRVNGVNPGPIETERLTTRLAAIARETGADEAAARAALIAEQKVIRFGAPEEVAALVAFLDSPDGRFLHGALIDLDGGATKGL
jgi:3-oxoacyl-[acyl-carrier protein] reductase